MLIRAIKSAKVEAGRRWMGEYGGGSAGGAEGRLWVDT